MATSKATLMGAFALVLMLCAGFVVVSDAGDAADAPTITWEIADAEGGVEITYTTSTVATEEEVKAIIGSEKFDATYIVPFTYKTGKTVDDVPSGLVKYIEGTNVIVPIDTYATLKTALADIVELDETKAKTVVEYVIKTDASLYTTEEIAAIVAEATEGYLSPEEVQEVIDAAVAEAVAAYADYKSPEDVKKAIDTAIEEYKAAHPAEKADNTVFIIVIGFLAVALVAVTIILALAFRKSHTEGRTLF